VNIKKRDYRAMMSRLKKLQAVSDAVITAEMRGDEDTHSSFMKCTLGHLYTMRRFGGKADLTGWMFGPVRIMLDTTEPDATGYDAFLVNKYADPDDSPYNLITKVTLNDTYGAGETVAEEPRQYPFPDMKVTPTPRADGSLLCGVTNCQVCYPRASMPQPKCANTRCQTCYPQSVMHQPKCDVTTCTACHPPYVQA
jgi:hypothetical protein